LRSLSTTHRRKSSFFVDGAAHQSMVAPTSNRPIAQRRQPMAQISLGAQHPVLAGR